MLDDVVSESAALLVFIMCSNYRPVTRMDRMLTFFGVERQRDEVPHDVFPTGLAPFIRKAEDSSGNKVVVAGISWTTQ